MCKMTSLPLSCCSNGNSDTNSEDKTTLLIPKTTTHHRNHRKEQKPQTMQKPQKSHLSMALQEAYAIASIAFPMILTGLLLYSRSMISMLFLRRLGDLALAGGFLAVGFANITGYSILSGLAMGMEPICGQAFGAKRHTLLGLCLQRTVLVLTSIPISLLWLNMKKLLILCGQDESIAIEAQSYLLYSLPDLLAQSLLHPLRIYLRSQSITLPLTFCATLAIVLHVPINYFLVSPLIFLTVISPSFAQQPDGPPTGRLVLTNPVVPQTSTIPVRDQDQPHHSNSYDILSIIRLSAIILLVLLLILRALLKLIHMLEQQEALSTAPPPLLPIHHASLILPTSDQFPRNVVFVMQQAPPAPPHSHNSHLSLSFRERISMAADDDDVGMDL